MTWWFCLKTFFYLILKNNNVYFSYNATEIISAFGVIRKIYFLDINEYSEIKKATLTDYIIINGGKVKSTKLYLKSVK